MIYFDNAATTPLDEIAIDALKEYGVEKFFNPSALYREALENTKTLNAARENILKIMHGDGDFIFTASGTEADNMAIYGVKNRKCAYYRERKRTFRNAQPRYRPSEQGIRRCFCTAEPRRKR